MTEIRIPPSALPVATLSCFSLFTMVIRPSSNGKDRGRILYLDYMRGHEPPFQLARVYRKLVILKYDLCEQTLLGLLKGKLAHDFNDDIFL